MTVRITCINKAGGYHEDPHEVVTHYGWLNEGTNEANKADRQSMVNWVKQGNFAYVKDIYGDVAYCFVNKSRNGTEFLQTHRDNIPTDNLLKLPECI